MSSKRFIKYTPSETSIWLRKNHTALYLLLSLAVERVKRTNSICPMGLQIGDAILGSFEDAGITRQQYRDALEKGEKLGIWEIVFNPKISACQKRTIKGTIKSIIVNVKESDIWDLNYDYENHDENQQGTIREPYTRKTKKEKEYIKTTSTSKDSEGLEEVFFHCLNEFSDLSQKEKVKLTQDFKDHEDRVKLAIEYAKIIPYTVSRYTQINWHCSLKTPPKAVKKLKPKELVESIFKHGEIINGALVDINCESVAFSRGMTHKQISFSARDFIKQLEDVREQLGLYKEIGKVMQYA